MGRCGAVFLIALEQQGLVVLEILGELPDDVVHAVHDEAHYALRLLRRHAFVFPSKHQPVGAGSRMTAQRSVDDRTHARRQWRVRPNPDHRARRGLKGIRVELAKFAISNRLRDGTAIVECHSKNIIGNGQIS